MILASTHYDTPTTLKEAVRLIRKIRPAYVLYDQIKPIPRRPLTAQAIKNNIITEADLEEFYLGDKEKSKLSRITISGIPRKMAEGWVSSSSRDYYLSPGPFFRIILSLRTKNDFFNAFKAGICFFREIFRKNEW